MDVTLKIHRYVEGKSWVDTFTVPRSTGLTVLGALTYIKEQQDPTLSFTCSCRSSICGACAVRVNGNAELSCEVLIDDLTARYQSDVLTIEPLGNFRVIRDLIVDWDPKYARLKKVKPSLHPKDEFTAETGCLQSPEDFNKYKKYAGCILCGSCVSECNKNALNQDDFLDPFAFVKAEKLVADSRSKSPAIEKLKAETFKHHLDDNVGARHAKAIYDDIQTSGTLDESKLNIKSEGYLMSSLRLPMALRLMNVGKMDPLAKHPVNPDIKTIDAIVKAAESADKEDA